MSGRTQVAGRPRREAAGKGDVGHGAPGPDDLGGTTEPAWTEGTLVPNSATREGRSPASRRCGSRSAGCVSDKIAVICPSSSPFFVLVAIFAGTIATSSTSATATVAGQPTSIALGRHAARTGRPTAASTTEHPFGIAPRTATTTSPGWSTAAAPRCSIAGVGHLFAAHRRGARPDRRLHGRRWSTESSRSCTDLFLTIPFLLAALTHRPPIIVRAVRDDPERYDQVTSSTPDRRAGDLRLDAGIARLIRGEVLSLREREFVQAARVIGMPTYRILLQGAAAQPGRSDRGGGLAHAAGVRRRRGGLAFLGIGVIGRPSWGQTIRPRLLDFFADLPALPLRAGARDRAARRGPQPAGRRGPRRPRSQDPSLTPTQTSPSRASQGANTRKERLDNETGQATGGHRRCRDVRARRMRRGHI